MIRSIRQSNILRTLAGAGDNRRVFFYFALFCAILYCFVLTRAAWAQSNGFTPEKLGLFPGSTTSELNLNWWSATTTGLDKTQVQLFEGNSDTPSRTVTVGGTSGTASSKLWHKIKVTDLQPDTKYSYKVSNDGSTWSQKYDYTTPPSNNIFKFAALADIQIGTTGDIKDLNTVINNWKATAGKIAAVGGVNLIVSAGDQVDFSESEYTGLFEPPQLRNISFAPVYGNHEGYVGAAAFNNHYNLPNKSSEQNYYFLYNNILFVGLNPDFSGYTFPTYSSAIHNRFKQTIQTAKNAFEGRYNWLVVVHHTSTLTCGEHADNSASFISGFNVNGVNENFHKLMTDEDVSLVISGHDHMYSRSKLMKNNDVSTDGTGTVYLELTSASAMKFYTKTTTNGQSKLEKWFTQTANQHSYTIIDVNKDVGLTMNTYFTPGDSLYDSYTLPNFFHKSAVVDPTIPEIATEPTGSTVTVGENGFAEHTLSVVASVGEGTLSYQWYRNTSNSNVGGTIIPEATASSYNVTESTAGTYYFYVVVSNAAANKEVTSQVVAVKVNAQPTGEANAVTATYSAPQNGSYGYVKGEKITATFEGGSIDFTLTDNEFTQKVKTITIDGQAYAVTLPAIPSSQIRCSSCEHYLEEINKLEVEAPTGQTNVQGGTTGGNGKIFIEDVGAKCATIVTTASNTSNTTSYANRYIHFNTLTGNISSIFAFGAERLFINGKAFAPKNSSGAAASGTAQNFDYVKANFPEAPEGGWYMYVQQSTQNQVFNASGGWKNCEKVFEKDDDDEEPGDGGDEPPIVGDVTVTNVAWSAPQLGTTYGYVKGETVTATITLSNGTTDRSVTRKLSETGFSAEETTVTIDETEYAIALPAITDEIRCSSCEYYLDKANFKTEAGANAPPASGSELNLTAKEACALLGTSGSIDNDIPTDAKITGSRYLHFTEKTGDIKFGTSSNYRFYINAIRKGGVTNDPPVVLPAEAPEGGWYMYIGSTADNSTTKITYNVSGGHDYCKEGEGEDDPPPVVVVPDESFETIGLQPGATAKDINFNWYSNTGDDYAASWVRILDANSEIVKDVEGSRGTAITTQGSSGAKYYHKVSVTGLQSDTEYKYQLSNDGTNWSTKVYSYKTPSENTFKFAAISDVQVGQTTEATAPAVWKQVATKLKSEGIDFMVHTGDQVDGTRTDVRTEYNDFFAPDELRSLPFAPVMGNHDSHCEFLARYNLPNEYDNPLPEGCTVNNPKINMGATSPAGTNLFDASNYYYLYNNVLFIGLNTAPYPNNKAAAEPHITKYENTINAAKNEYAGQYDFIVVHHHKSTQSVASHAADTDVQYYVEAGFERLMTDHKVSLVLAGHDHINARSKFLVWKADERVGNTSTYGKSVPNETTPHPVNTGYGPFSSDNGDKGTIYLTLSTSSGSKYYAPFSLAINNTNYPYLADGTVGSTGGFKTANKNTPDKWLLGLDNYEYTQKPEYTIVEVNGETMTLTTYRNDQNNPMETFTITTENIFGGKHGTPTIARQPAGGTIKVGESNALTVEATVAPASSGLSYQWYKNDGEIIEGETNPTYTVSPTSVGTYSYYVVITNNVKSLSVASNVATVVVEKGTPEYDVPAGLTATYGDLLSSVTLPTTNWTWLDGSVPVGNAGTQMHKATFTPNDEVNYNVVSSVDVEVAVDKANGAGTVAITGWTYGEAASTPAATNGTGTASYAYKAESANDDAYSEDVPVNAGTYTVRASFAESDNYLAHTATADFAIDKAPLTVTANDKTVTYGDAAPAYTVGYSVFAGSDTEEDLDGELSVTSDYESGNNVGDYDIIASGLTSNNYKITYEEGKLTVNKAQVAKPELAPSNLVYNGKAQSVTLNVVDGPYTLSGATRTNAGSNYVATVELNDKANYEWADGTIGVLSLSWEITKAQPATVEFPTTTKPVSVVYDPAQTLADIKLVGGSGDGDFAWASSSIVPTVSVTDYDVTFTPDDAENYDYSKVKLTKSVALTVTKAQIAKPALLSNSFVYNGAARTVDFKVAGPYELSDETEKTNVGEYTATAALTDNANYVWKDDGKSNDFSLSWEITPAPLTVTAKNETATYGEDAPEYTVTYSAFAGKETEKVLGGKLSVTSTYKKDSDVGSYDITASGLTSDNYAITYKTGTLTVNRADGEFVKPKPINATYTAALKLKDLKLNDGYEWAKPNTQLSAKDGQKFAATYVDPSDNYEEAEGEITVNVAKAAGTFTALKAIDKKYAKGLTLGDIGLPEGYEWDKPNTQLSVKDGQKFAATYTDPSGNYESAKGEITVNVTPSSVLAADRVIPSARPDEEATVVLPVTVLLNEFTAGPNPVIKSLGAVGFFRQGKRVAYSELQIYDAVGNIVNKVKIADEKTLGNQARRQVGSWNLTDKNGRQVAEGTYLVKGVIKTYEGKSEKVSLILSVK